MKYARRGLLAVGFALIAGEARAQEALEVPYEQFTLDNGLTVLLHEDHATPTVSVNLWYGVGSANEVPGKTGFAHLFEHLMFEGSGNVPAGTFDILLEGAGGVSNGSTSTDRTNYYEDLPTSALELVLFLESDRMGYLLDSMTLEKLDNQRDVVKNERRQRYENQPYGLAAEMLVGALYADGHPYQWSTIGSMADLDAAGLEDVKQFFRTYYGPNNATLAIAGDIDFAETRSLVEKWFSEIPAGPVVPPIDPPVAALDDVRRLTLDDRVQLPRLYMCWHSPPFFAPGDAELDILASVLASGKNSRLYRTLVYDLQVAQDVNAYQASRRLGSQFCVVATARDGHELEEIESLVDEQIALLLDAGPTEREVERSIHQWEASFLDRLEQVGGGDGKANQMNRYHFFTGNPDYFNEDLSRYQAVGPSDVRAIGRRYLDPERRVILYVVPEAIDEEVATLRGSEVRDAR